MIYEWHDSMQWAKTQRPRCLTLVTSVITTSVRTTELFLSIGHSDACSCINQLDMRACVVGKKILGSLPIWDEETKLGMETLEGLLVSSSVSHSKLGANSATTT